MLTKAQYQQLQDWQQHLAATHHRGFLQLKGEPCQMLELAQSIDQILFDGHAYFVGQEAGSQIHMNQVKKLLGQEFSAVVFNAYQGFHSNAFAALAGTVKAGGLFILIAPDFIISPDFDDVDTKRWQSNTTANKQTTANFLPYVQSCIDASGQAVVWQKNNAYELLLPEYERLTVVSDQLGFAEHFTEQEEAVKSIGKVVTGHAKRPLVLLGDRGRGKSTCLALAAAQLLQAVPRYIVVCSSHQSALNSFYQHFCEQTKTVPSDDLTLPNGSRLQFLPPDQLLAKQPKANAVFIDEAAAISTAQLEQMLKYYNRLVFASTVHGYEGNGRGLMLRFSKTLAQLMPQWKLLTLQQPIRFAQGDALENLVNDIFILDAELPDVNNIANDSVSYHHITQHELAYDKALLTQIFSLLVSAHYQTSPDDLRLLLDHADISVFYALANGKVVGALLVMQEGGFSDDDVRQLQQGSRRFRGHILPQQLYLSGIVGVLSCTFLRVVRIAVHPDARRNNIATQLLHFAQSKQQADFFGASFACSSEIVPFWQKANCDAVLLGQQKESASGCYSCVFLQPLSAEAQKFWVDIRQQFQFQLQWQLRDFASYDVSVIPFLLNGLDFTVTKAQLQQVDNFLQKRCHWQAVRPALLQVALQFMANNNSFSEQDNNILLCCVLLDKPLGFLQQEFAISTQQQRDEVLRGYYKRMVDEVLA